jgi:hypothetical protein
MLKPTEEQLLDESLPETRRPRTSLAHVHFEKSSVDPDKASFGLLDRPHRVAKHVVFAGVLPIVDIVTDIIVVHDMLSNPDTTWFGVCSIAALSVTTFSRTIIVAISPGREYRPLNSVLLGIGINLIQLQSTYNVYFDVVKGKIGNGSLASSAIQLGCENCFQTLVQAAFLLSPTLWAQAAKEGTASPVVVFSELISLLSIANGALTVTTSGLKDEAGPLKKGRTDGRTKGRTLEGWKAGRQEGK